MLNKLEFGEPQASGILSPAYWRGATIIAQGGAASAAEPWVRRKINQNPERSERVADVDAR